MDGLDSARFRHQATPVSVSGISGLRLELGVNVFLASQQGDGLAEEAENTKRPRDTKAKPYGL